MGSVQLGFGEDAVLVCGTTSYGREVAHRHIFSDVNDLILLDRNRMQCAEVAHRHIFSDMNNFILRAPHPLEEGGSPRLFHWNWHRRELGDAPRRWQGYLLIDGNRSLHL